MSRKLASIQIIKDIVPIKDADKIEIVKVLGWQCVAKKGEFKKGDKCIYFEIDSFLPIREEFEFLRTSSYKKTDYMGEGFRLRTIKLRGEYSQGLCVPIEMLIDSPEDFSEGDDVTELLGVKQWEYEERACTDGTAVGDLPDFISKTDETRIQTVPDIIPEFGEHEYYISTKMDGSSHSIGIGDEGDFFVTGHRLTYKDDGKSGFYEFIKKREINEKLKASLKEIESLINGEVHNISIQGELCGPGIQSNRLKILKPEWYVFSVSINRNRVGLDTALKIVDMIGATFVPIEERGYNLPEKYPDEESLLKRAEGQYTNGGQKEGIVIRTVEPVYSKTLNDYLSIKVISNKYLVKYD